MAIDISFEWRQRLQPLFLNLEEGVSFEFTSPVDYNYNCLSWALSCDKVPFENAMGAFWPWKDIPDDTADGWARVCEIHGFTVTQPCNAEFVAGYEKIAIFKNDDGDLHAARQDRNGMWKSKLGDMGPDIDHVGLHPLEPVYGKVVIVLQRPRSDW